MNVWWGPLAAFGPIVVFAVFIACVAVWPQAFSAAPLTGNVQIPMLIGDITVSQTLDQVCRSLYGADGDW